MKYWTTPTMTYYPLYADLLQQTHVLIAGATGSGKSVCINGMLVTALGYSPYEKQFILIDPKRVELVEYSHLPHTLYYASEPDTMLSALHYAMDLTERRYKVMQRQGIKKYQGSAVYVVIDELADLMTTNRKSVQPLIQRLAQIGRAANIHIVAATQCPLATVIPTPIKVNFDSRIGLRTRSRQDSRNILGMAGCETLPAYGMGYYMTAQGYQLYQIPMYSDLEKNRLLDYWKHNKHPHIVF